MVVMEDVKGQRKPDEMSIRTDIGEETGKSSPSVLGKASTTSGGKVRTLGMVERNLCS